MAASGDVRTPSSGSCGVLALSTNGGDGWWSCRCHEHRQHWIVRRAVMIGLTAARSSSRWIAAGAILHMTLVMEHNSIVNRVGRENDFKFHTHDVTSPSEP